jgi:ornithine cyclodeaminase/alanine dehydrogenase-like protein (mu-crystallin family)
VRVLVLTASEVDAHLPMPACIEAMADALAGLARGELFQPLRMIVRPKDAAGLMAMMPAYRGGTEPAFGVKAIGIFPGNTAKGKDTHQGAVVLFDGETGELTAIVNAAAVTAIRTAAVSGVATRLLARDDAAELALVGSGIQARSHLAAVAAVRPLRHVRVASRHPANAQRFAEEMRPRYRFLIEPVETVEEAVRGADVVATVTDSVEPVVKREWIAPGAHLNVVGASVATRREVDSATMAAASLFVDRRESTVNEAGDYLMALQEGAITPDHIRAELGELLTGAKPGRTSRDEITLFKSLGLAVEDLAAASLACRRARDAGAGTWVEF